MVRPIATTLMAKGISNPLDNKGDEQKSLVQRLTGGMFSSIDPQDVPENAFVRSINTRTRFDKPSRRNGHTILNLTAPDANPVNRLIISLTLTDKVVIYRVTSTGIWRMGVASWLPVVGSPTTIGSKISYTTIFDTVIIADGFQRLIYIRNGIATQPTTAPVAKFVTGSYNRVVVAYDNETDGSISMAWSGEYEPGNPVAIETFDFTVNSSSGREPLVESPSDVGDHIRFIQGFVNNLIVLRDYSVSTGVKQPSASSPFRFSTTIPGIGSDCSYAAHVTRQGLFFPDTRTRAVYLLNGDQIDRISVPIELPDLFGILGVTVVPTDAFGGFDGSVNESHLFVPESGAMKRWVFNHDTKAWSYDESDMLNNVTAIGCLDKSISINLTIGELTGTIGGLAGTIGSLVSTRSDETAIYIGRNDGEVVFEDSSADDDDGDNYNTVWESRDSTIPPDFAAELSRLMFSYNSTVAPVLKIEYSTDAGVSWADYMASTTLSTGLAKNLVAYKNIYGNQLRWKITVTAGRIELLRSVIPLMESGIINDDAR